MRKKNLHVSSDLIILIGGFSASLIGVFLVVSALFPTSNNSNILTTKLTQTQAANSFTDTFDGKPTSPQPFTQIGQSTWDIAIQSRNPDTWDTLVPFQMMHGPNCEPPLMTGATAPYDHHELMVHDWDGNYDSAVFKCADHIMTGIYGIGRSINDGYAMIALTPNQMVDFTNGPATIRWDMTTFRTTQRDWVDVWITPYDDNLQLPFDTGDVDLQGMPMNTVHLTMTAPNDNSKTGFKPTIIINGQDTGEFQQFTGDYDSFLAYEDYLPSKAGDPKRRDTFEITISKTHLKMCMPQDTTDNAPSETLCWVDKNIKSLPFTKGVVQFAHHSYTPNKDCDFYTPLPCGPDTWHWDNISISPSVPFTMIKADQRAVRGETQVVTFTQSAPANAKLRFSAIGSVQLSFNNGSFQSVTNQSSTLYHSDHFASYFVNIPQGTSTVRFKLSGSEVMAKDFAIWSQAAPTGTTPTPIITTAPSPTTQPTRTPTPTITGTTVLGDINRDRIVNVLDLGILVGLYGRQTSSDVANVNLQRSDLNGNGLIDIYDIGILSANYGKTY
ncbi:hypothetical protein HGA91_00200 [candidate division WWE3 bacterium]|nr:hypothetical protein [candidate division WWE3 bacterium]